MVRSGVGRDGCTPPGPTVTAGPGGTGSGVGLSRRTPDREIRTKDRDSRTDMAEPLMIDEIEADGWSGLRVAGEIDLATADQLESSIRTASEQGARFVLDLSPVSFMDSTGIRVVVLAHRALEERGGSFAVVTGSGPVRRVFEVTGLSSTLSLYRELGDLPS